MRMQAKALILNSATVVGTLGIAVLLMGLLPPSAHAAAGIASLIVFFFFAIVQLAVLVCPNCKTSAVMTPNGSATPFVGTKCRYCGKAY
jgi:hypothetical protein